MDITIPISQLKSDDPDALLNQPILLPATTGSIGIVRSVKKLNSNSVQVSVEFGRDLTPAEPDDPADE